MTEADAVGFSPSARVAVFAPTSLLTITIEEGERQPDIHLHPGGQGLWVARMAATLGAEVILCASLGGESGGVLHGLIGHEPIELRASSAQRANGIYIHDRRSGQRIEVASALAQPLRRHELDELYGITLTTALTADAAMLTGPFPADAIDAGLYRRLSHDLRENGKLVVADLSGPALTEALAAGIDVLKCSHEEMLAQGYAPDRGRDELVGAIEQLHRAGAASVVLSRGPDPALVLKSEPGGAQLLEVQAPRFEELDHAGAGDSMFAALGVALASGVEFADALRLAAAAGALNVTRHGLGSGTRPEIERLAELVTVRSCGNLSSG